LFSMLSCMYKSLQNIGRDILFAQVANEAVTLVVTDASKE